MTNNNEQYKILIVDDEEVNFFYLKVLLTDILKLNCELLHSLNGKKALEMCKTNSGIDFVFMDIKMPVMDGYEATEKIKVIRPALPIVALTAYATNEAKEKATLAGCNEFFSKPISEETISEIISTYLIDK